MEEFLCSDDMEHPCVRLIQENLSRLESVFALTISIRGNKIMFNGPKPQEKKFRMYLEHLLLAAEGNGRLGENEMKLSLNMVESGKIEQIKDHIGRRFSIRVNGKEVFPKTVNQREYVHSIRENELVFGIGPAGTGKTFLAIAMALNFLINKKVERIVLTRPVVEAGEKLGFLPGDIQQKINPYLRPLYDALYFLVGFEKTSELIEKGTIEIAPLAYMRGRTISDAFIILDEGQNTSNAQMKMLLTRFGENSRVVVTADITQIDLDDPKKSGVFRAIKILKTIPGIGVVHLTIKDIVRHPLVQKIVEAYEKDEK